MSDDQNPITPPDPTPTRVRDRETGHVRTIRADQQHLGDFEVLDEPAVDPVTGDVVPAEWREPDQEHVPFNPDDHNVTAVNDHLADADVDERSRVLAAEAAGQARKGIVDGPHAGGDPHEDDDVDPNDVTGDQAGGGESLSNPTDGQTAETQE